MTGQLKIMFKTEKPIAKQPGPPLQGKHKKSDRQLCQRSVVLLYVVIMVGFFLFMFKPLFYQVVATALFVSWKGPYNTGDSESGEAK